MSISLRENPNQASKPSSIWRLPLDAIRLYQLVHRCSFGLRRVKPHVASAPPVAGALDLSPNTCRLPPVVPSASGELAPPRTLHAWKSSSSSPRAGVLYRDGRCLFLPTSVHRSCRSTPRVRANKGQEPRHRW
jgi:hypothetical protein